VFCSLNNNYKYTPEVFSAWMRILQRTPGSVLWLLADNTWAEANLRREAQARGVDSERLLFAGRVLPPDYLARYACADLFLDTFPFNAGTTANDALWMGLPILTLCGRTFASRMASALLTAAQLPELITYNLQDYEEKAVALAHDPQACKDLRSHLESVRSGGVLFDTAAFARNLEQRLQQLVAAL
jgi:predicted O-linked N-acetylglucosamine transferase (SPINDLY family)